MSKYSEILARLKEATGLSRDVDARIYAIEHGHTFAGNNPQGLGWIVRVANVAWPVVIQRNQPALFTASIDAALALVEKMPGVEWQLDGHQKKANGDEFGFVLLDCGERLLPPLRGRAGCYGGAATAPLAILIALFEALKAKEAEHA